MARRPAGWLCLFAALLVVQTSGLWYASPDGAVYVAYGRAWAAGEPLPQMCRHVAPGYPLLIAPAFLLNDRPLWAISLLHGVLGAAYLAGVYLWARRMVGSAAVFIAGIAVLNTGFGIYYRRTLKETAFMAFAVWTVLCLQQLLQPCSKRRMASVAAGSVALLALLLSIRFSGVVLAGGFIIALLVPSRHSPDARRRAAGLAALVGLTAAGALLGLLLSGRDEYLYGFVDSPASLAARLSQGLWIRVSDLGRVTLPGMFKAYHEPGEWLHINTLLYSALFIALIGGWYRLFRRQPDVWICALPLHFLLYVIWPYDQGARFFVCLVAPATVCLWSAVERLTTRRVQLLACLLAAHLAAGHGYWLNVDLPRARQLNHFWPSISRIAAELRLRGIADRQLGVSCQLADADAMLQLALERVVEAYDASQPPPRHLGWIVQPADAPLPACFVDCGRFGRFRLASRRADSPATSTALLILHQQVRTDE